MTKEQAIKKIQAIIDCDLRELNTMPQHEALQNEVEALDMAIKAFVDSLPPVTPTQSWIPCSERLPKDLEPVNITWVNHNPKSYYTNIKDKPFTATGVYFNGQWYWWNTTCTDILAEYSHNYDDIIDNAIKVTAWQPLPKPYKEKRGNKDGSN